MGKLNAVYDNQIFVKCNPDDFSDIISRSSKAVEENKEAVSESLNNVNNNTFTAEDMGNIMEYARDYLNSKYLPEKNYDGMEYFWLLKIFKDAFCLISIRTSMEDEIFMRRFHTLEQIEENYRSLSDIMDNEEFIGKQIDVDIEPELYALYNLDNVCISCNIDENNNITKLYSIPKLEPNCVELKGEKNNNLDNKAKVLKLIYKSII